MKVRNRITLWITGAGLLAGVFFSLVIFFELIEQPLELLDTELDSQAHALLAGLAPRDGRLVQQKDRAKMDSIGRLYWFKLSTLEHVLLYGSPLTEYVDLPVKEEGNHGYTVNVAMAGELAGLEYNNSGEVSFRVRVFTIPFGGQKYLVQIGRPMGKFVEEINELIFSIGVALLLFTLVLILLGYVVAGKILQPITAINRLAREIRENTLDKRIPLGATQDELYALSSSLNDMFDRLQFSFQRQKEFIANASHELKTPLTMQRLFFDEAGQREDLPEDFKKRLTGQTGIVLRMSQLVKNLLDLSALDRKEKCSPETINLSELIRSVFEEFDGIIQNAEIKLFLEVEEHVLLSADRGQMNRLLINLIDNAIKYNREQDGEIRFVLRTEKDKVHMEIYNSGRGVPREDLERVFTQFYRVEQSRSIAHGGSGLGLTLARRIVELHHGIICMESEFGSWTLVRIVLPSLLLS